MPSIIFHVPYMAHVMIQVIRFVPFPLTGSQLPSPPQVPMHRVYYGPKSLSMEFIRCRVIFFRPDHQTSALKTYKSANSRHRVVELQTLTNTSNAT